jgi:hypothetical protein
MIRPRRRNSTVVFALWANAILLGGILLILLERGRTSAFAALAFGAEQAPIAGGAGIFVMPGQLASNVWGCYLMDVDRQTLMAYEYQPGTHTLRLCAGRGFKFDRELTNFGTVPAPDEVRQMVEQAKNGNRQAAPANQEQPKQVNE